MIRAETPADVAAIRAVTAAAFAGAPHSSQTEAAIVDALRQAGALTLSLVAERDGGVVGHAAFSPVTIDGRAGRWFGLGPVSVLPEHSGRGLGRALIEEGLRQLRLGGAEGCVVLGNPAYYGRFGFANDAGLRYEAAPSQYFQCLAFGSGRAKGIVDYHPAFDA